MQMRIGFADYPNMRGLRKEPHVLIVTSKSDVTSDFLGDCLSAADINCSRLNTDEVDSAFPSLRIGLNVTEPLCIPPICDVTHIYWRRPEYSIKLGQDNIDPAQLRWARDELRVYWQAIARSFSNALWINKPHLNYGASCKPEQLQRAIKLGLKVPDTLVTASPEEAYSFHQMYNGNIIAKPLNHGFIQRINTVDDTWLLTSACQNRQLDWNSISCMPTLLQQQVFPKTDLRVTVLGDQVVCAELIPNEPTEIDCRVQMLRGIGYRLYKIPDSLRVKLCKLVKSYGLSFAAIDLVKDERGDYIFLELNPSGQWAWMEIEASIPISQLFINFIRKVGKF